MGKWTNLQSARQLYTQGLLRRKDKVEGYKYSLVVGVPYKEAVVRTTEAANIEELKPKNNRRYIAEPARAIIKKFKQIKEVKW